MIFERKYKEKLTMEVLVKKEDKAFIVAVKGKMDATTAPEFEDKMNELIAQGENCFIIDFSDLTYISSAGLRSVLASAKKLKSTKGKLLFASINGSVKNVFDISGFALIFEIYDSVKSALLKL